jgi:hypothetical protein
MVARRHPWLLAVSTVALVVIVATFAIYIHFYRLVDAKLRSGPFSGAADIYAAPRTIAPGDGIDEATIAAELRRAGYSNSPANKLGYFAMRPI